MSGETKLGTPVPQYISAFVASCNIFAVTVTTSVVQMSAKQTTVRLKDSQLIFHIYTLCVVLGLLVAGFLQRRLGPKRLIQFAAFPVFLSCLVTAYSRTLAGGMAANILHALTAGIMNISVRNYVYDIAEHGRRASIFFIVHFCTCLGAYVGSVKDAYISDKMLCALVPALVPVISLMALSFLPESPAHLCRHGELAQATHSIRWLRGGRFDVDGEMKTLRARCARGGEWQSRSVLIAVMSMLFMVCCNASSAGMKFSAHLYITDGSSNTDHLQFLCETGVALMAVVLVNRIDRVRAIVAMLAMVASGAVAITALWFAEINGGAPANISDIVDALTMQLMEFNLLLLWDLFDGVQHKSEIAAVLLVLMQYNPLSVGMIREWLTTFSHCSIILMVITAMGLAAIKFGFGQIIQTATYATANIPILTNHIALV